MGIAWEYHGNSMGIPWEYRGNIMEIYHGNISWEYIMGIYHGKSMGIA